jgi:hypothetical protein
MEHLWSRAGATGGKRWQMGWPRERLEQAQTVATGCDQLRPGWMVRRGSTVRVRQRASGFRLLSQRVCCLGRRRSPTSASTQRPPVSTVAVARRSVRRAAGSHARVHRGRGGRNAGRSWSSWRPCSGRARRWKCRHGARRWRRCVEDRRPCVEVRSRQHAAPASTRGYGSCAGRGSRPFGREEQRSRRDSRPVGTSVRVSRSGGACWRR